MQAQQDTEKALKEAESAETLAKVNEAEAERQKATALRAEQRSREFRYATDMQLAATLVSDKTANASQIFARLSDHDPESNQELENKEDLRGFEWHYLKRMVEGRATIFEGFEKEVVAVAMSPEGELVTLDSEGRLQHFSPATRQETRPALDLKKGRNVSSTALSPDGRRVALAIGDKVHLVDTATGNETARTIPARTRNGLLFSPAANMVITVDTGLGWWDAATGNPIAVDDFARGLGRVDGFDAATGNRIAVDDRALTVFQPGNASVSASADGLTVAVGNSSYGVFSVFRVDLETREIAALIKQQQYVGAVQVVGISPDGRYVAVTHAFDGRLVLYDIETGREVASNRSEHAASITAVAFSPEGTEMVTASADGVMKVWKDHNQLESAASSLLGHTKGITGLAFASRGQLVVSSSHDRTTRIWDLQQDAGFMRQNVADLDTYRAAFSPDGLLFAAADRSRDRIRLWEAQTGRLVREIPREGNGIFYSAAFSPDGRLLAAGFGGEPQVSHVELWDLDQGRLIATLPGTTDIPNFVTNEYTGLVSTLAFSPDGRHLAAGFGSLFHLGAGEAGSHPWKLYDVATHRTIRVLEGHQNTCAAVVFSQDGSKMATASFDGTARMWDTAAWRVENVLSNPASATEVGQGRVMDVAFSPDGTRLAMASFDGNVTVWDTTTGELLETLSGHSSSVIAVAFSPDGRTLASGGGDQNVRLWNTATWRELAKLDAGTGNFQETFSLSFSPDGSQLFAGSEFPCFWSAPSRDQNQAQQTVARLALTLQSNADFASRVRMLSEDLRLHEAIELLSQQHPENQSAEAATAATRANWYASQQQWDAAVEQFDRLKQLSPNMPDAWLRTPGLLRLATALLHQDRPTDAASLLAGGEKRRAQDGNGTRTTGLGIQYTSGMFPLTLTKVDRGSPAWHAGMRAGDLLMRFDEVELTSETNAAFSELLGKREGTQVKLTIQHPGQAESATVQPTIASYIRDDVSVELIERLLALVDQKLAELANDTGLLELRAEIAGQSSEYGKQVADYTAAIAALSEWPEAEAAADLTRLYRRRGNVYGALKQWQQASEDFAAAMTAATTDDDLLASQALALAQSNMLVMKPPELFVQFGKTNESHGIRLVESDGDGLTEPATVDGQECRMAQTNAERSNGNSYIYLAIDKDFKLAPVINIQVEIEYWASGAASLRLDYDSPRNAYTQAPESVPLDKSTEWKTASFTLKDARLANSQNGQADFRFWLHNTGRFFFRRISARQVVPGTESRDPWVQLASIYRIRNEQESLEKLVERHPGSTAAIGELFAADQEWHRAVEIYSLVITPETMDAELLVKRAKAYEELKDWNAAAADWSRAAKENPAGARLLAEFASRLSKAGQHDLATAQRQRARAILEATLQADPGDAPAIDALASLLLDMSEPVAEWTTLQPSELKTAGGETLALQDDSSLLVERIPYTLTLADPGNVLQVIRIETSQDETPPAGSTAPFTEYQILSTDLPERGFRGRYVRIDLPGDNSQFPRRAYDEKVRILTLAEVQVFRDAENIARAGRASQSSTEWGGVAARAIDGNVDGRYLTAKTSTHTGESDPDPDPWWELDVGSEQPFERVVIWNRNESDFGNRLKHFRLRILSADRQVLFERFIQDAPNPSTGITRQIQLAKVEPDATDGVAQLQVSFDSQSEQNPWRRLRISVTDEQTTVPADAIGTPNVNWTLSAPSHVVLPAETPLTAQEDGSYLVEVDDSVALPVLAAEVKAIRVETASGSAAKETGSSTFKDYRVEVLGAPRSESGSPLGRYVRIDLPGTNEEFPRFSHIHLRLPHIKLLTLAEVQVFQGERNIAIGKQAFHSSIDSTNTALRAIYRNTAGNDANTASQTAITDANPFWELDLGNDQAIDRIVLWNSTGWFKYHLNHVRIRVLNNSRNVVLEQVIDEAPNPSRAIDCRSLLVAKTPVANADTPQWLLRLSKDAGVNPGGRFRISSTQDLSSLAREEAIAEARNIPQPVARLAAAYDVDGRTSHSAERFRRALDDADKNSERKQVLSLLSDHPRPLAELLKQQPDNMDLQLALARSLVKAGQKQLTRKRPTESLAEFQQAGNIFTRLLNQTSEPTWTVLKPIEMTTETSAQLHLQSDDSLLVQTPDGNDTFSVTFETTLTGITGLRLETLADPRLPGGGPGTSPDGNFLLSKISLQAAIGDRSEPARTIGLANAAADFSQGNDDNDVSKSIDGSGLTGWAIHPQLRQNHVAVFATAEKIGNGQPLRLTVRMAHQAFIEQMLVGRFRISVTTDSDPATKSKLRFNLTPSELANLDVSIGKALAQQDKPADAATAFARALDRVDDDDARKQLIEQFQENQAALTLLAEQRPQDSALQLALAKSLAASGKKALTEVRQDEALPLLAKAQGLFASLAKRHPESEWTVLEPTEMTSARGADLTLEPDGSIFVSGEDGPRDNYTLTLPLNHRGITAFRLETLPDARLPHGGAGRDIGRGGFILNQVHAEIRATDHDNAAPLTIRYAFADWSQPDASSIEGTIDSNEATYWAVNPRFTEPHQAVFVVVPRAMDEQGEALLNIHIECGTAVYPLENLGRFRLSVTSDPSVLDVKQFQQELKASGLADLQLSLANAHGRQGQIDNSATAFSEALDLATDREARTTILQAAAAYDGVLDKLSELRSMDATFFDMLARHYQTDSNLAATRAAATARKLYEQQLAADPANSTLAKDLSDLMIEVRPAEWTVLNSLNISSEGGATFTPQQDGSILVSGPHVAGDVYTITVKSDVDVVGAIRLEVLPDESLPANGPGRHESGNFQLQSLKLFTPPADGIERSPVAMSRVTASFAHSANDADVAGTIDDTLNKVWNVSGQSGKRQHADFVLSSPLHVDPGTPLTIVITHKDADDGINLGRFRLSVSSEFLTPEFQKSLDVAAKITATASRLGAAYHVHGEFDRSLHIFARSIDLAGTDQARAAVAREAAAFPDIFAKLQERFSNDKALLLGQAKYLAGKQIAEGRFQAAVEGLSGILADFPNEIEVLNQRATAYMKLTDWKSADADYRRVIELENDDARRRAAERTRAEVLMRMGQFQAGADARLREMLLSPGGWDGMRFACYSALLADKPAVARMAAIRLYRLLRDKADLDGFLSGELIRLHIALPGLVTKDNQQRLLAAAAKAGGDWTTAYTAAIHYRLGNLEQAQALLDTPLQDREFQALAAMLCYDQGETTRAAELLQRAENWFQQQSVREPHSVIPSQVAWDIWANNRTVWHEAARKLMGPRIAELDQLLANEPDRIAELQKRAELLANVGLYEDALSDLQTLVTLDVASAKSLALHGRVLAGLGRDEEALPYLNQAIEGGSIDGDVYAARGNLLLKQRQSDAARVDLERSIELKPNALAASSLADLLLAQSGDSTAWSVLKPAEVISEGGATLTVLDDHSILASGKNPQGDAYRIVTECDSKRVSVVRLEALTHESLPNQGPGRDEERDRGNFDLVNSEILQRSAEGPAVPISLSRAIADYSAPHVPVSPSRWNVGGGVSGPHTAVFLVDNPVTYANGGTIEFRLQFSDSAEWPKQNLGRFRLSVSEDPEVFDREEKLLAAMKLTDPWARLAAAYLTINDQQALDKLIVAVPSVETGIAELYFTEKKWDRAIAAYSKLITDQTTDVTLLSKRAAAYIATEQWDLAEADWLRVIKLQPNQAQKAFDACKMVNRWQEAAEFGWNVIEQDLTKTLSWLQQAPVLVLAGDAEAYRAFCDRMVKQFGENANDTSATHTLKACLLQPGMIDMARLPVAVFVKRLDDGTTPEATRHFRWGLRGLLALRSGKLDLAVKYIGQAEEFKPSDLSRAMNLSVLALAQRELQHPDEAKATLAAVAQLLTQIKQAPGNKVHHDLLIAEILFHEAEALMKGKEQSKESDSEEK